MKRSVMMILTGIFSVSALHIMLSSFSVNDEETIRIRKTIDFTITGDGSSANWSKAGWHIIPSRSSSPENYTTKVKVLYSATGMYFLYSCGDTKLTSTMSSDFLDLWNEDVVEVFIQPNVKRPVYLEYELSPMNYELPILIYNDSGKLNSWIPFHYNEDQKTRHATSVQGGEKKGGAEVKSWMGEFFIPYKIMKLITAEFPKTGTKWKGNFFRVDYDNGGESLFSWRATSGNFHEYKKFGVFQFE
ncbi:MAG: carbohydrate-binding family 9-like protein [Flavitalea sp.]